jgi:hypothetical protein
MLEFAAADPRKPPAALKPKWDKPYSFTEHSYRGIAAAPIASNGHPLAGEILLLNILLYEGQAWSYLDRNIWHAFMRDEFFRGTPISVALVYARIREGKAVEQRTLIEHVEGQPAKTLVPNYGALHATADGRLSALYHVSGGDAAGNYALQLLPKSDAPPVKLPLKFPLGTFFTATERLGTEPSDTIDLYGHGPEPLTIRYAQVKIKSGP